MNCASHLLCCVVAFYLNCCLHNKFFSYLLPIVHGITSRNLEHMCVCVCVCVCFLRMWIWETFLCSWILKIYVLIMVANLCKWYFQGTYKLIVARPPNKWVHWTKIWNFVYALVHHRRFLVLHLLHAPPLSVSRKLAKWEGRKPNWVQLRYFANICYFVFYLKT